MTNADKNWESDYRIPADTQALHYDLYLHPDLQVSSSDLITFHSTNAQFCAIEMWNFNGLLNLFVFVIFVHVYSI